MGKYCCFFHPEYSREERKITDKCPICHRPYGYLLEHKPREIEDPKSGDKYVVDKAISRGFYGLTYLCTVNRIIPEQVLLKVIPANVYDFFKKSFKDECIMHATVAKNATHLVKLSRAFDANVEFEDEDKPMKCYVEELQYINGPSLREYLEDKNHTDARIYAQITIDLLEMWNEFFQKYEYHNDLHLDNIMVEQLTDDRRRPDSIYDRIRLIAIDLNSVSDGSASDVVTNRIGDRQYIANHINRISDKLRHSYNNVIDMEPSDYRIMMAMKKISQIFSIPSQATDQPEVPELIRLLKNEFDSDISYSPWLQTFTLTSLSDAVNAQTLSSCYVPKLLIDPDGQWIKKISTQSPQLITGMRGCGKTMLLKAIDIHARIESQDKSQHVFYNIQNDNYIGIMASCSEIIALPDIKREGITKLILLYAIEILRAARHVSDIDPEKVKNEYHKIVAKALESIFSMDFAESVLMSESVFERHITGLAIFVEEFCTSYPLRAKCRAAFETLADAANSVSPLFKNKKVLFLLDDVSTRYINVDRIGELLTELLFMSERCAFKVTTEMQTIYNFKSPGNIELSQIVRDYEHFDLGADVYDRIRNSNKAKDFIEEIINKRLSVYRGAAFIPSKLEALLGNNSLKNLANYIIDHHSTTSERSMTYYGATALASLCVGDIGDVIGLYDSILNSNGGRAFPVPSDKQNSSFQTLCTHRMYNLEKKNHKVRDCVKAFAEASYLSLLNSRDAITENPKGPKIRQYTKLYISNVRTEKQFSYIRELIDAGVFVYADTNGKPGRNDEQIKLAFRKLFGLSNYIPLGDSDRYELSGDMFEKWFENPSKELLLSNAGDSDLSSVENDEPDEEIVEETNVEIKKGQMSIEDLVSNDEYSVLWNKESYMSEVRRSMIKDITDKVRITKEESLVEGEHFDVAFFGLGFEDRCLSSVKRVLEHNTISKIVLIEYNEKGYKEKIDEFVNKHCKNVVTVRFDALDKVVEHIDSNSSILLDVSGLYKPVIFEITRQSLSKCGQVLIVHTMAEIYYPLNDEIKALLPEDENIDNANNFTEIIKTLTTGDEGDYTNVRIFNNKKYDPTRPKSMVGFVSPKNQRIYSILDEMDFEKVVLLVPAGGTQRDKLSRIAGNIAKINYSGVTIKQIDLTNPVTVFNELASFYVDLFLDQQSNFDITLTGSKMQAVAAAVLSSVEQITQCWYVKPKKFDTDHFTKGVGETICYRIEIIDEV